MGKGRKSREERGRKEKGRRSREVEWGIKGLGTAKSDPAEVVPSQSRLQPIFQSPNYFFFATQVSFLELPLLLLCLPLLSSHPLLLLSPAHFPSLGSFLTLLLTLDTFGPNWPNRWPSGAKMLPHLGLYDSLPFSSSVLRHSA